MTDNLVKGFVLLMTIVVIWQRLASMSDFWKDCVETAKALARHAGVGP
jgi:hypothetical protein